MIVLDTHAWVWWVSEPDLLPAKVRSVLEDGIPKGNLHVSSISVWEVAMLVARGRLELTMPVMDWVSRSEALPFLHFVPVDNALALAAVFLEDFSHQDPADRLIVATALTHHATVVTKDRRMRAYPRIQTLW